LGISAIKKELPDWPDAVLNEWLVFLANRDDTGWPPPEPLTGAWQAILGGRPLAWWRNVTWTEKSVECGLNNLAPKTRGIVTTMRAEINAGTADDGTKRRFNEALFYILHNGTFPNPVSAMEVGGQVHVLDGNHRIAALTAAHLFPDATPRRKGLEEGSVRTNHLDWCA
jgi:hypothetical protein